MMASGGGLFFCQDLVTLSGESAVQPVHLNKPTPNIWLTVVEKLNCICEFFQLQNKGTAASVSKSSPINMWQK